MTVRMNLTRKLALLLALTIGCNCASTHIVRSGGPEDEMPETANFSTWEDARSAVTKKLEKVIAMYKTFEKVLKRIDSQNKKFPNFVGGNGELIKWLSDQKHQNEEYKEFCSAIYTGLGALAVMHGDGKSPDGSKTISTFPRN